MSLILELSAQIAWMSAMLGKSDDDVDGGDGRELKW